MGGKSIGRSSVTRALVSKKYCVKVIMLNFIYCNHVVLWSSWS